VLAEPEQTSAYPDILAGFGMTRSADGSGEFLSTQAAPAAPTQPWRVGNLGATLYAADSTSSQPLIALDPGMDLAVIEDGPDWTFVETPFGMQGYVRKRYMSTGQAPVAQPPAGDVAVTTQVPNRNISAPALRAAPAPIATEYNGQVLVNVDGSPVTPNYGGYPGDNPDGTRAAPPKGIVYHYTVGDMPSFMGEFMGDTRRASANYVVDRDGTIYEVVPPDYVAWTHGDTDLPLPAWATSGNLNQDAIGIEIVNSGSEPYTPEQIAALETLTRELTARYGIPASNLIGHEDVTSSKSDPGKLFPWDVIRSAAAY
jgi:hypothetical protein